MMKQYYIYKVTNKVNKKIYIGSHYGKIDDLYFGSGVAITKAIKKYGKKNFIKEIIEIQPTKELMLERESYWLSKFNCAINSQYYNMTNTAGGGCLLDGKTEEEKKALYNIQLTKRLLKQEQSVKKMLETRKNWSEEQKQKVKETMAQSRKEAYAKLSPEQKAARVQKISETKKNLPKWKKAITSKKHSEATKKWWNSLTLEQKIEHGKKSSERQKGKIVPFEIKEQIRQTLIEHNKKLPKHIKEAKAKHMGDIVRGKKWCNNSIKNFRKTSEQIKELGYYLGKL